MEIRPLYDRIIVKRIDQQRQFHPMKGQTLGENDTWHDAADLSAGWRALWDEQALYLAVEVSDDVYRIGRGEGEIWNQDGLQFLVDPTRLLAEKAGKYDISMGVGHDGPLAWCHLSGDSSVPTGAMPQVRIAVTDLPGSAGGKRYEIAIPWDRLAPFTPAVGANLGLAMILNEDDGLGREGFAGWFSGVHSKQLDLVGDLVLQE